MRAAYTIAQSFVNISARRPVRTSRLKVAEEVLPHDHEFAEICLVTSGSGLHRVSDGQKKMEPGDVFITLPGQVHAILPYRNLEVWNVYYLAEWFLRDVPEYQREPGVLGLFFSHTLFGLANNQPVEQVYLSPKELKLAVKELKDILVENEGADPSPLYLASSFGKLLHLLARSSKSFERVGALPAKSEVWEVLNRIEERLVAGREFDATELAARFPVGADRLARIFKHQTGLTPFAYYQRRRLQLGRRMLLNRDRSITEVAVALRFADASHFAREFRRFYGITPREFRSTFAV